MKKQILSGVLAAVMLLSPAYAAESGASDSTADAAVATAAEAQSVKLVFASDKTLTGANGDDLSG